MHAHNYETRRAAGPYSVRCAGSVRRALLQFSANGAFPNFGPGFPDLNSLLGPGFGAALPPSPPPGVRASARRPRIQGLTQASNGHLLPDHGRMCAMWRNGHARAPQRAQRRWPSRRIVAFAVACEYTTSPVPFTATLSTVTGSAGRDPFAVAEGPTAGAANAVRRLAAAGGGASVAVTVTRPCFAFAAGVAEPCICVPTAAASGGLAACAARAATAALRQHSGRIENRDSGGCCRAELQHMHQ